MADKTKNTIEENRLVYVLKGSPDGSIICAACDGYDGSPVSRRCAHCDGDGYVYGDEA
jgi:hypothetical protein